MSVCFLCLAFRCCNFLDPGLQQYNARPILLETHQHNSTAMACAIRLTACRPRSQTSLSRALDCVMPAIKYVLIQLTDWDNDPQSRPVSWAPPEVWHGLPAVWPPLIELRFSRVAAALVRASGRLLGRVMNGASAACDLQRPAAPLAVTSLLAFSNGRCLARRPREPVACGNQLPFVATDQPRADQPLARDPASVTAKLGDPQQGPAYLPRHYCALGVLTGHWPAEY